MALSDELQKEAEFAKHNRCRVCRWFSELSDEDARAFAAWLDAGGDKSKLYRAASRTDSPIPAAYSTFSRHLRECC